VDRFKDKFGHLVTKEKLREVLNNYFSDGFEFSFKPVDAGYENINIIVKVINKKYVLRIYNDKQYGRVLRDQRHLLYELTFLSYLAENGIPVAKINKTLGGKLFSNIKLAKHNLFVVLFDFIEGSEIKRFNKEKISDMAVWMAKIHELSFEYKPEHIREEDGALNYYYWWLDAKKKGQEVKDPDIRAAYLPIIEYYQQYINPKTVKGYQTLQIHSDMHQGNLRFKHNKLAGIFDYDDTRHSVVPEDIGMFFHSILKRGSKKSCQNKIQTFFNSYESILKLSNEDKRMSLHYALEKRYQGRYFEAYHDELNGKLTLERKQYYLNYTKRFALIKELIKEYSDIIIPKKLESKRLFMLPVSTKYSKEIYDNFTDEVTALMYPSTPKNEGETLTYLKDAEKKTESGKNYEVLIFLKENNEFIGGGGVHDINTKTPEFGIWIKKAAHGHKYGREAIKSLKNWADKNLDYDYLKYPVEISNIPSRKIPESLGGKVVKEYDAPRQDGATHHLVEYHIYKNG
jgi:Ser/Thr protein kinase RdoA (MazF antagonist)/RimJ/RimL family protein N-acetyltransferase